MSNPDVVQRLLWDLRQYESREADASRELDRLRDACVPEQHLKSAQAVVRRLRSNVEQTRRKLSAAQVQEHAQAH